MRPDLDSIHCASVPVAALAALAGLRREPGVTVTLAGDRAWVRWDAAPGSTSKTVLRRVLPLAGSELYDRRMPVVVIDERAHAAIRAGDEVVVRAGPRGASVRGPRGSATPRG